MKTWKKKDESITSIKDAIEKNTGIPMHEFLVPKRNPFIQNLKEAVELTKNLIFNKIPITIMADYDCDGVMAGTIMFLGLKEAGANVKVRFPRRFSEGYGLSMKVIDETAPGTAIITVDNGIAAIEQVAAAKKKGITVIVTDHHIKRDDGQIPDADIIVDPNALEGSEFNDYCGAAIAYRFVKELVPASPLLIPMMVFASIATVADVMPLIGDNRNLVIDGLKAINAGQVTLGMKALLKELKLDRITEGDYGFKLGPIVNASGRLKDDGPLEVFNLLSITKASPTPDNPFSVFELEDELAKKAQALISTNTQRQDLSRQAISIAHNLIEKNHLENRKPIILYQDEWCEASEGIIGIVAGHLAEEYCSPVVIFTKSNTEGIIKGSGRTFGDVHLKSVLDKIADYIVGYGGHAGAAGLSIRSDMLDDFTKAFEKELVGYEFNYDRNTIYYDMEISTDEVPRTIKILSRYAPFGERNPQLVFKVNDFKLAPRGNSFYSLMGKLKNHIRLYGTDLSAVGFDMSQRYKDEGEPKMVDIIGYLSQNFFQGRIDNQIEIIDFEANKKIEENAKTDFFKSLESILKFD